MLLMTVSVANFLERSKRLCDALGRTPAGLSHLLFNDGRTLPDMMDGRLGVSVARVQRAERKLQDLEKDLIRKGAA